MKTIAIGLDSADPSLIEEMLDAGALPNIQRVRNRGAYGRLENFDIFTAELPWTTFATGVMPEETGYWSPLKYTPDYGIDTRAAYEYDEYPAFFALGDKYRVCCFDVPQVRLQKNLNGIQINAWGAHSPQVEQDSNNPTIYRQLLEKYGPHPGLHADYALALDMVNTRKVYDRLMEGIARRGKICRDLYQREDWNLFLTVFGEPHGAGHNFYQFEPGHPLKNADIRKRDLMPDRPMWNIMEAVDRALGELLDVAPDDSNVIIFSTHGMGPNTMDLPSIFFLPEFMYRWSFNRSALGSVAELGQPLKEQVWGSWPRHVWNTSPCGPLTRLARNYLPSRLYDKVVPYLDKEQALQPMPPTLAEQRYPDIPSWQPAFWYRSCWPNMKAFALMSFSEGYIRINVKGREQHGIVDPAEYAVVVDEICKELRLLKCSRSGEPMVRKIVRVRDDPMDTDRKKPDADIIIGWQDSYACDAVEHPVYGRIGPVPHYRAGSHRPEGFMFLCGAGVAPGARLVNGHALDIAPTILAKMGINAPDYMTGRCVTCGPNSTILEPL